MTQGVRGTRDFYPEDMRVRNWLFEKFHSAARSHGFEEYDAPVLETEELYTRKSGEEITQQLYNFEDKGGRKVSLRPEMTPSLARMVMARSGALALPIKWYSIPQCWRYERTQRGRGREHYQWNVDIWGAEGIEADAEIVSVLVHFFRSVGLSSDDLVIRVSSRKVLEEVLGSLGVTGDAFSETCIIVDKMDKLPAEAIEAQLTELGLDPVAISTIQSVLGIKNMGDLEGALGNSSDAVSELSAVFSLFESYGIGEWVELDASVVRGLAYYTGPVFEAHDRAASHRLRLRGHGGDGASPREGAGPGHPPWGPGRRVRNGRRVEGGCHGGRIRHQVRGEERRPRTGGQEDEVGVQARREACDGDAGRVVTEDCQDQALGLGGGVGSPLRPTVIRIVVSGAPIATH